jgi:hypothetical protein
MSASLFRMGQRVQEGNPSTYSKKEVADIVGNVNRDAHVGEVESVAQGNKGQSDDVVQDELLEIFPGLFQEQHQHDGLLGPVARLKEIVCLVYPLKFSMRKTFKHSGGVEVPERALGHDIQPKGTKDGKVDCSVDLLHESHLLALGCNATPDSPRPDDPLHDEFACKGENNDIEADEGDVELAFAVHVGASGIAGAQRVREEDSMV